MSFDIHLFTELFQIFTNEASFAISLICLSKLKNISKGVNFYCTFFITWSFFLLVNEESHFLSSTFRSDLILWEFLVNNVTDTDAKSFTEIFPSLEGNKNSQ